MKHKPKKEKPIIKKFNDRIETAGGETIEGIFSSLETEDQTKFLFRLLGDTNEQIFRLQQQVDYLSSETGLSADKVKMLQLKDVWSTEEVCGYFSIDPKTLNRGVKSGEWPKPARKTGGTNRYRLTDLKTMFIEQDGNTDELDKLLGYK